MPPKYGLDKIKFATDRPTFERAVGLYEKGRVTQLRDEGHGFSAVVVGTQPYRVFVSACNYDCGHCECYLGQNDTLCKHMVAVAIRAVTNGKPLTDEDKKLISQPVCSGRLGALSEKELSTTKQAITAAMRYIKPYNGPSRVWFEYQDSLGEGCTRLSAIVSGLLVSEQTARLLVTMLLRLDRKLSIGGVDDSDGTVGGFIEGVVAILEEYARCDARCIRAFRKLAGCETAFGWEEPLVRMLDDSAKARKST